jgi:hypothetical protein
MPKRIRKTVAGVMAFAALAVGGAAIAGAATSTSTSTSSTSSSTPSASAPAGQHAGSPGPGFTSANAPGTAAHEDAEKAITGQAAEKAQAAAVATISGGKAGAVTSDFRGGGYEVTVTKTDGSQVTVHLDSSFKVQAGPPMGGRPGHGPPSGQAPSAG